MNLLWCCFARELKLICKSTLCVADKLHITKYTLIGCKNIFSKGNAWSCDVTEIETGFSLSNRCSLYIWLKNCLLLLSNDCVSRHQRTLPRSYFKASYYNNYSYTLYINTTHYGGFKIHLSPTVCGSIHSCICSENLRHVMQWIISASIETRHLKFIKCHHEIKTTLIGDVYIAHCRIS